MKRRKYGTTWNSKRGHINPHPFPNVGISRARYNREYGAVERVLRLMPAIIVNLTADIKRFVSNLRAAQASMAEYDDRRSIAREAFGIVPYVVIDELHHWHSDASTHPHRRITE